jgi:hydroxymethylpyrimidine/phosphomethylpyrimidine kinase
MKVVLSIAGSDSSGGAGIQADLKTMTCLGVYGMSAITALTAQNTMGVNSVVETGIDMLEAQIDACLSDIYADAVKTGMLPSAEQVRVVARKLKEYSCKNVVVDPVMVATSGSRLMGESTKIVMANELFPIARVITPNIPETESLLGTSIKDREAMEWAARKLNSIYGCGVLVKGGHSIEDASDVLFDKGSVTWFEGKHIDNSNTHGTGCTLSSAIASHLARGYNLKKSIERAKRYLENAIEANMDLGRGQGPLNHMANIVDFQKNIKTEETNNETL